MKSTLNVLACLLIGLLVFASCTTEDESEGMMVDLEDPSELSQSIEVPVEGATVETGNPPAPSANGPQIENVATEDVKVNPGNEIFLGIDVASAQNDIAGIYLQVDGADTYYNIPLPQDETKNGFSNPNRSGFFRKLQDLGLIQKDGDSTQGGSVANVPFKIPDNINLGRFCVSYCVYDADSNVSNVIRRCIEVSSDQVGIDDTQLLAGKTAWTLERLVVADSASGSVKGDYLINTTQRDTLNFLSNCLAVEIYRQNAFTVKLRRDGRAIIVDDYSFSYEVSPDSCYEFDAEEVGDFVEEGFGYWSFNNKSRLLRVFIEDQNPNDDFDENEFVELNVEQLSQTALVVTLYLGEEKETYYFTRPERG